MDSCIDKIFAKLDSDILSINNDVVTHFSDQVFNCTITYADLDLTEKDRIMTTLPVVGDFDLNNTVTDWPIYIFTSNVQAVAMRIFNRIKVLTQDKSLLRFTNPIRSTYYIFWNIRNLVIIRFILPSLLDHAGRVKNIMSPSFHMMYFCTFGFQSPTFRNLNEFKNVTETWLTNWQEDEPTESIYIITSTIEKMWHELNDQSGIYDASLVTLPKISKRKTLLFPGAWVADSRKSAIDAATHICMTFADFNFQEITPGFPGHCASVFLIKQNNLVCATIDIDDLTFPFVINEDGHVCSILQLILFFRMPMLYGCRHLLKNEREAAILAIQALDEEKDINLLKCLPINKFNLEWAFKLRVQNESKSGSKHKPRGAKN